jgi:hypothetical protein
VALLAQPRAHSVQMLAELRCSLYARSRFF